jgi:thiamine transport system substrate-binding protein
MKKIIPVAVIATVLLAGCTPTATDEPTTLVLVTHDSFALSEGTLEKFTEQTGIAVSVQAGGDAGELANKLVLTKDSPLGDVVFGIDNTFASRVVNAGVLESYVSADLTEAESQYLLPDGSGGGFLTPIDTGDVCINIDHAWFSERGIPEPTTLVQLADDETYKDLLVVEAANSSSPGLAFLLATIAAFDEQGEDAWQQYWGGLMSNGVKIDASWSDAYYVDFSGPSSEGDRPLVVSYASSPPFEPAGATGVMLDSCFRQTEYAGVIAGTAHSAEAQQLVDFLFSTTVQNDIPENMYVFPVNSAATLPAGWENVEVAEDPWFIDPADIDANREEWLKVWSAIVDAG